MLIEELDRGDLDRFREMDRSETARFLHVREGDELRRVEANLDLPTWSEDDLARVKDRLAPKLAAGGILLGALDGDRLAGAAVLAGDEVAYGFRPARQDDPRLRGENEPADIQLTLELEPGGC